MLSTHESGLTPGDNSASSYWITSPLTTLRNETMLQLEDRGQDSGFWYLFPDKPVGPSTDMFFVKHEAKHTPISLFENNVAQSYKEIGMAFFRRLGTEHEVIGCSTYTPLTDPLDKNSEMQPITLDGFIGYNNRRANVIMRSSAAILTNFYVANSHMGIELD